MRNRIPLDRSKTAFLIVAAIFCLMRIILVILVGKQGSAYAGPALEMTALFFLAVPVSTSLVLSRLIKTRYKKERYASIHELMQIARLSTFLIGLICSCLLFLLSRPVSLIIGGEEHMYLILITSSPIFVFLSMTGTYRGYFRGIKMTPPANTALILQGILTGVFAPVLGYVFRAQGNKVAELLRDSSYPFVYGAAGVMLGVSLASLVTMLYCFFIKGATAGSLKKRMPVSLQTENESSGYLKRIFYSGTMLLMITGLLLELPILTDYRILHAVVQNKTTVMVGWGAYYSKTLSLVFGTALILIIPFSGYIKTLGHYYREEDTATFRSFYGMMMRLAGYILLPASFFYIAASKSLTGIIGDTYDASACVSLEINGILVLFIGLDLLLVFLYMEVNRVEVLLSAAGISYVIQTISAIILSRQSDPGITVAAVPLTVFYLVFFFLLCLGMRRELIIRNTYAKAYVLMTVSAIIGAIAVFLMQNLLEDEIGYLATTVIVLFIYLIVYIMATLLLAAADLRNIGRIPGGSLIINIADLFNL